METKTQLLKWLFNRQEFSGALGDIGTDFPLIVAMIAAADLHTPSVLILFGLMQVFTGLVYQMPMPVQPLKAMATLVITQKIIGSVLLGAGLAIGVVMLLLSLTGSLDRLQRLIPKAVIRGIQMGLGVSLCLLACKEYIAAEQWQGYLLAGLAFALVLAFMDNKRYPVAVLVVLLGLGYAFVFHLDFSVFYQSFGIQFPQMHFPTWENIAKGFVLLALPQIPLSLGNSIMATKQVVGDFFPEKNITVRKIGITYALMNLVSPFFGGIPCCHGSGGIVGHYTFGGRSGGSVIIYGLLYIVLGLCFGDGFAQIIKIFPLPILGVILLFEGLSLMLLVRDTVGQGKDFVVAVLVAIVAFGLPYGFVIALVVGTALYYLPLPLHTLRKIGENRK